MNVYWMQRCFENTAAGAYHKCNQAESDNDILFVNTILQQIQLLSHYCYARLPTTRMKKIPWHISDHAR